MTRPIEPLADVEAHMAEQKAIAVLLTARVRSGDSGDRIAYALDVRLIETHATVASDADYPGWAERIAVLQAANRSATKEA